jgi:hypothetical protein
MSQPGAMVAAGDIKKLKDDIVSRPIYSDLKANPAQISADGL